MHGIRTEKYKYHKYKYFYIDIIISFAQLIGTWTFELLFFDSVSLLPELFSVTSLHKESTLFESSSNFKAFSSSRCLSCSLND